MRATLCLLLLLFAAPALGCRARPASGSGAAPGTSRPAASAAPARPAAPAFAENAPRPVNLPIDTAALEKDFGVKCKSAAFVEETAGKGKKVKAILFLMECTKDSDDPKALRLVFHVEEPLEGRPDSRTPGGPPLLVYFFDRENVPLGKKGICKVEGEITGKAGDCFRVFVVTDQDTIQKTRKLALRLNLQKPGK